MKTGLCGKVMLQIDMIQYANRYVVASQPIIKPSNISSIKPIGCRRSYHHSNGFMSQARSRRGSICSNRLFHSASHKYTKLHQTIPFGDKMSQNRLISANLIVLTLGSAAVYFGPFPETRDGLFVAWNYPHTPVYENVVPETLWKICVAISGLSAVFIGVKRITLSTALSDISRNGLGLFCGLATAMLCIDQSENIVRSARRFTRIVSYFLDGLKADLFARDLLAPIWERKHGITIDMIEKLHEHKSNKKLNFKQKGDEVPPVETISLDQIEQALLLCTRESKGKQSSDAEVYPYSKESLLAQHKKILISELLRYRREEIFTKAKLSIVSWDPTQHSEVLRNMHQFKMEKKQLKVKCQNYHHESLSKAAENELQSLVSQLSLRRMEQFSLAKQLESASSDTLVITDRLMVMDEEKRKLKEYAKDVFAVKISSRAESFPNWRAVQANWDSS